MIQRVSLSRRKDNIWGSGIQEWLNWRFWLRVSQEIVVKVSPPALVISRLDWPEDQLSSSSVWLLAAGFDTIVHGTLSTWHLASPKASYPGEERKRKGGSCRVFYNLVSEKWHIIISDQPCYPQWGRTTEVGNSKTLESLGAFLDAGYHNIVIRAVKSATKVVKCCDKEWQRVWFR